MLRLHGRLLGFLRLEGSVTMAAALNPQFEDWKWWLVLRRFSLEGFRGCCMLCCLQGQRASARLALSFSLCLPSSIPMFSKRQREMVLQHRGDHERAPKAAAGVAWVTQNQQGGWRESGEKSLLS